MKQRTLVSILFLILISCNKISADVSKFDGTYIGYFHRSGQDTARVSLNFNGDSYQGSSSAQQYPALGKGSFDQTDNTINFTDSCNWTPDVDQTLVLKGVFNYQYNTDGTIRIWQQNKSKTDEYILRRPVH